jgi:hypothetical protein
MASNSGRSPKSMRRSSTSPVSLASRLMRRRSDSPNMPLTRGNLSGSKIDFGSFEHMNVISETDIDPNSDDIRLIELDARSRLSYEQSFEAYSSDDLSDNADKLTLRRKISSSLTNLVSLPLNRNAAMKLIKSLPNIRSHW